jgi:2,3-dihydroxybiphenyl 1,2-dioxygenase
MGLGHLVVYQPDLDASTQFYTELLGFRVSDVAGPLGRPMAVFLHCNPRHHSIALFGGSAPKRINHFMLECNSLDDVGSARDIARQVGAPIVIDLGRHMNDRMVSFYVANPSHFAIEYGWGGRTIDDACWQVGRYESVESIWGHPELSQLVAQMGQTVAAARG